MNQRNMESLLRQSTSLDISFVAFLATDNFSDIDNSSSRNLKPTTEKLSVKNNNLKKHNS